MSNYLISVVVAIYNVEEYVSKCIESLLNQSYMNLQIILVDDGSKDLSGEICDRYAAEDSRIQVIHKANGGLVTARKAGLEIAKGDYIGFVDGDDYVELNYFETLLKIIVNSGVDFTHMGYIVEKGEKCTKIIPEVEGIFDLYQNGIRLVRESVLDNFKISTSIVTTFFKSNFIKECYNYVPNEQSLGEDLICFCVCLLKGEKVYFSKEALYHYNIRNGSLTDYGKASNVADVVGYYNVLVNIFKQFGIFKLLKKNLDNHLLRRTMIIMKHIKEITHAVSLYYFTDLKFLEGKRIIIYGAGDVGQDYYSQISKNEKCDIVGWLDSNYKQYHFDYRDVEGIEKIDKLQYDFILIAVKRMSMAIQIKEELIAVGVEEQKIIWEEPGEVI